MNVQTIYLTCIIGGIFMLLISIVFSAAGDFFEFADLDFELFSMDIAGIDIDFLPVSMKSLCLAATVFGSVSMLLLGQTAVVRHVAAGLCAYIGAFILQNITGFLKNHQSEAESLESICSRNYIVNIAIPEKGYGSVASTQHDSSVITMTAKSMDGSAISAGTRVSIVEMAGHVAIVVQAKS